MFPLLTLTAALAAVTATRSTVIVAPGVYAEAATLVWPTVTGVQLIGTDVTVTAPGTTQVLGITPGAQAADFVVTIRGVSFAPVDTQDGIKVVHTDVAQDLYLYLMSVGVANATATDYSLLVVHDGVGQKVVIDWDGDDNIGVTGKIDLAAADGDDDFTARGVRFEQDIDAGTDIGSAITLQNCEILHEGFSGGGATVVVTLMGVYSKAAGVMAAADDTDVTANSSITGPIVV
jgi:hypothetical protein